MYGDPVEFLLVGESLTNLMGFLRGWLLWRADVLALNGVDCECPLYRTALHCTALYCTALYCTALYCTVPYRTALYDTTYTALFELDQPWLPQVRNAEESGLAHQYGALTLS